MIGDVLALLHTLFDIVLLRKGPDALPRSPILLMVCFGLWLLVGVIVAAVLYEFKFRILAIDMVTYAVALASYSSIVIFYGKSGRIQQMVAAMLGCGAVMALIYIMISSVLTPFLGADRAFATAFLLWLWSIAVEGHVLARTIDSHWYFGIIIAMATLLLQFFLGTAMNPGAAGVA